MRKVLQISGSDRVEFLENLVSNSVKRLTDGPVYAALLTPQGKYLADFIMSARDDVILLDVDVGAATGLLQRLNMYRLRANVEISETTLEVIRGIDNPPVGAFIDPRHSALGWRAYVTEGDDQISPERWAALRVEHVIPETGVELIPNNTYILEAGFERLHGVDFRKGCYVGQEVTARMKHKTDLKKGLAQIEISTEVPEGTKITTDGKPVGTVYTQADGKAIAYLRFERVNGDLKAGDAVVKFNPDVKSQQND